MLNLPELLQGVLDSLEADVAPNVTDAKSKAQLYACLDLLSNLAVKIDWKAEPLCDECDGIGAALRRAKLCIEGMGRRPEPLAGLAASIDTLFSEDEPESENRTASSAEPVDWFQRRRRYAGVFEELVRVAGAGAGMESEAERVAYAELRSCVHEHLVNQTIREALYLKPMRLSEMSKA